MDGGINMPNVPEAAMVPVARGRLYFWSRITGNASNVIITTLAPIMPVVAAIITPKNTTAKAKPPGTRRNNNCRVFNRSRAMPLFSIIVPMKINIGMATKVRLLTMPP